MGDSGILAGLFGIVWKIVGFEGRKNSKGPDPSIFSTGMPCDEIFASPHGDNPWFFS
jgi:hypothetical protein